MLNTVFTVFCFPLVRFVALSRAPAMGTLHCLCRLVVLLSLGVIRETVTSPNDQCQFIFKEDSVLQVGLSQDAGAKVTMDLHAENKFKCAEACCESEGGKGNGYNTHLLKVFAEVLS